VTLFNRQLDRSWRAVGAEQSRAHQPLPLFLLASPPPWILPRSRAVCVCKDPILLASLYSWDLIGWGGCVDVHCYHLEVRMPLDSFGCLVFLLLNEKKHHPRLDVFLFFSVQILFIFFLYICICIFTPTVISRSNFKK
jgi:hypothetical protein